MRNNKGQFTVGHAQSNTGKTHFKKGKFTDENHPNWKGDAAGYFALHDWIYRNKGKASYCSFDSMHVSHHFEWANISGAYLRNVDDYASLCIKCHRQYDMIRKGYFAGSGRRSKSNLDWNAYYKESLQDEE